MKREITTHKVNGLNDALRIEVLDEPGQGNACHNYQITTVGTVDLRNDYDKGQRLVNVTCRIRFQDGPISEVGVNGISNEALLAVVRDRLEGFQSGQYACKRTQEALYHVLAAVEALYSRTDERLDRGVEGTHVV